MTRCFYQQLHPCKDAHPLDPDHWCSYCCQQMGYHPPQGVGGAVTQTQYYEKFVADLKAKAEANPPLVLLDPPDYKTVFYQLLASITIADHLGDVAESICHALDKVSDTEARRATAEGEMFEQLQELLSERGVTTVHGTSLGGK